MKKYFVFIICFILVYYVLQLTSGWLLTLKYSPDLLDAWNNNGNIQQKVDIRAHTFFPYTFIISIIAASLAFLISNKTFRKH